jgi:hypothetical protein
MDDRWWLVEQMLRNAKGMHFDGCHKIYLSMDDEQVRQMEEWDYETYAPNLKDIVDWYDESCGLRFINAVFTNDDANDGFVTLIPQGYGEGRYCG